VPLRSPIRPLLGYLIALLASSIALAVIGMIEPRVGFVPLLLLAAVAIVEHCAGLGPAIFTTVFCTLGSLAFAGWHQADDRIHNITQLALLPVVAGSVLYLMEARRKQRQVVQEQLLELSTLLESMQEGVCIFGSDGRVVDANPIAENFMGVPRGALRGRYYTELAASLDVKREEEPLHPAQLAVARALRGEAVSGEERTVLHPREQIRYNAIVSASPMRSENGEIIGALLVVRDVTELTQLQRRIADTERHLAIGQMASGIAHDFNNVLNTITQAVAVLQLYPDRPYAERRAYLEMIDRAARTGAEIIKRVREYIRGGTGELGPVNVSDLLRQALDLTEPLWRKHANIKLHTDLKPVNMVRANAADLQRVFANLIINAIQAMPNGGELRLECDERDGTVFVRVRDTGVGIAPEQQKRIFMPYYTTKPHGTGLGLSTAQRTVLAQGGNISFSSEPGTGTTFLVTFPALTAKEEVAA
jgi:two-component system sensor histidine kinase HydH